MTPFLVSRIRAAWLSALAILLAAPLASAQEPVVEPTTIDPPSRVARLSLADGEVSIAPAGTDEWAEAVLNRPITSQDRLWVGADARAELQVGSATIHLDRDTGFGFIELDDDVMQMSLTDGAVAVRVRRLAERETIQLETPNATIFLRRTGEYHVEVDPATDRTVVKTRSGEAEVVGASATYTVRADEQGEFRGLDTLTAGATSISPRTPFESWANDRERQAQESTSARYVSRDVVGYEDLDDHGEWVQEREYGYVWRPTHVASDWAPYRFGRWAWVSPWGWTWIDNTRWGFAPFHYGRWAHVRNRWCWVPGPRHLRPVYAPALVGWIGGPSVNVSVSFGHGIGWFPLGPREIYVPGYRHTPRYIRHVNRSNTIIINNTYITNAYHRRGSHLDYRHRHHAHAITAVQRDHFVGGRPVGHHRVRLNEHDLRQWRDDPRPPAIAPYRESVLAGQPRVHRDLPPRTRNAAWATRRGTPNRIDFTAERRAIENNGGRPVSRSHLIENPKQRGDFRVARPGAASDIKRAQPAVREHTQRDGAAPLIDRSTSRQNAIAPRVERSNRSSERIESLRAVEPSRTERPAANSPARTIQQQHRRAPNAERSRRLQTAPSAREQPRSFGRPSAQPPASTRYTQPVAPRQAAPRAAPRQAAPRGTSSQAAPRATPRQTAPRVSSQSAPSRTASPARSGRSSSRAHQRER